MFCENCGKQMLYGDKFCPHCGALNKEKYSAKKPAGLLVKKKMSIGYILGIGLLIVCIITGIIFFVYQVLQLNNTMMEDNKTTKKIVNQKQDSSENISKNEKDNTEQEIERIEEKVEITPSDVEDFNQVEDSVDSQTSSETNNNITSSSVVPQNNSDYILPESNSRFYSEAEIKGLSEHDLFIARNEIYARHGRMFNDDELKTYFSSKSWYSPQYTPKEFEAFGDSKFNEYEIFNRNVIKEREKQLKGDQ